LLALERERKDVVKAIDGAFRRSRFINRCLPSVNWLGSKPVVWRIARPARALLLKDMV
jgi:hypothetical protein